ncbi:MAG: hypothetical protein WA821_07375 [Anaerolineales bacterium]
MSEPFYLGRLFDLKSAKTLPQPLSYDPADLTTHAVVTGMTGSGKTGLCIGMMEEAALQGIPAILIDPKGDLTNLLLHFPALAPADFQPWLDADTLRRQGESPEQAAAETAAQWRQGLADWNVPPERIAALAKAAQFAVYTPGSDAGLQISVLSSLEAPQIPWEGNREILREKISSAVTALLGLVGYNDIDPLRSREHILLSNIFEYAWSKAKPLDLTELILQIQTPPFEKLGAFPVDNFFPAKDRNDLAITVNNILAAPAFEAWREGAPMDIPSLLYTADGRPRHTVFYIAHLSDGERMFFVTLLLAAFEAWMRTQSGSTSLRALLYFDELYGYLPPTAMPPSKTPLLRMLKQARAFGVGLVLATQNPMDVDYKALSNAGSWFVGKLQTERDKNRLLDGLQSASADLDRNAYSDIIGALGKRSFLLHNVHASGPVLFQTRWTMNFLAGPLTRTQLPALNQLAGAAQTRDNVPTASSVVPAPGAATTPQAGPDLSTFQPIPVTQAESRPQPASPAPASASLSGSETKPVIPSGIAEYYLPLNLSITEAFKVAGEPMPGDAAVAGVLYRPNLLGAAKVRFLDRRYAVDSEITRDALVDTLDKRGQVRWDDFPYNGPDLAKMDSQPSPQARYMALDAPLGDGKLLASLQKDFADWVFRTTKVSARANEALKVYAGPDVSPADFRTACSDAARDARDAEIAKLTAQLDHQVAALQDKLAREEREKAQDESAYNSRKLEEGGNLVELGASMLGFGRKKNLTTQLTKHRLTDQAKGALDEAVQVIQQYQKQLQELEQKRAQVVQDTNEKWAALVNQVTEIPILAKKSDVFVEYFGVAWQPFYLVRAAGEIYELPGSGA